MFGGRVGWQPMHESKKNTKRYVEGIARNVDVYIDPWRVQFDVFVVVNSRDIHKKKKNKIANMLLKFFK